MPARHTAKKRKARRREPTKGLNLPLQNDVLDVMVTHFEQVYQELNDHVRWITKIHQRVNELSASVKRLSKR